MDTSLCPCLLHRAGRWLGRLGRRLGAAVVAALLTVWRWCWPAWRRVPISVQCGDHARRCRMRARLRQGVRDEAWALGGLPALPCRIRVLAAAGTPPDVADLGSVLASYVVRPVGGRQRAVITLAAAVHGQPITDDDLVAACAAALDRLADWQPGQPAIWVLPAGASRSGPAAGAAPRPWPSLRPVPGPTAAASPATPPPLPPLATPAPPPAAHDGTGPDGIDPLRLGGV